MKYYYPNEVASHKHSEQSSLRLSILFFSLFLSSNFAFLAKFLFLAF